MIAASPIAGHYEQVLDRESAYEKLGGRDAKSRRWRYGDGARSGARNRRQRVFGGIGDALGGIMGGGASRGGSRGRQTMVEAAVSSTVRAIGSSLGREIVRGVLGSIMGGRRR